MLAAEILPGVSSGNSERVKGRPVIELGSLSRHMALARERVERAGRLCARVDGFDLHGPGAFGAADRERLEELVRLGARPALANDRLSKRADGRYAVRRRSRPQCQAAQTRGRPRAPRTVARAAGDRDPDKCGEGELV